MAQQRLFMGLRNLLRRGPETIEEAPPAIPAPEPAAPLKTAFVLLGGGAHGAAQAGALTSLVEAGIVPDVIVGISAGAWNAAFWASQPDLDRAHSLENVWKTTTSNDILGVVRWRVAVSAATNRGTLYDAAGLRRMAQRHLGGQTFDDLKIPTRVLAVNVSRGEPIIFEQGNVLDIVLASAAIPGIFPPVIIDGDYYVDGGLADWAGCEAALKFGARRIFLISCGAVVGRVPRFDTLTGLLERSFEVAGMHKFRWLASSLEQFGAEVITIQPELHGSSPLNFNLSEPLILAGRAAGARALADHPSVITTIP